MYSILRKKPKRADRYWFLNISPLSEPFGMRYTLETLVPDVAVELVPLTIQPHRPLELQRVALEGTSDPVPAAALAREDLAHKI